MRQSKQSGYLLYRDDTINETLQERIRTNQRFTSVVGDDQPRRQVALLSINDPDRIVCASLMVKGSRVTTTDSSFSFSNFVSFKPPVDVSSLKEDLPRRVRNNFGIGRIPPATWVATIDALKRLRPGEAVRLDALQRLATTRYGRLADGVYGVIGLERDATALALTLAGLPRTPILGWTPTPAPFLLNLPEVRAPEDTSIMNDANYFPGMEVIRRYQVAVTDFTDGQIVLTIAYANRTAIERTTGVDLVYYNHNYDAYTLVQYKRMTRESNADAIYRPTSDASLTRELDRMRALNAVREDATTIDQFRLHPGCCFLKLCPPSVIDPGSLSLIKGMYFPFDYWELVLSDESTTGDRGGTAITYRSAGRYLTNDLFAQLVQGGWIGSRTTLSEQLSATIRDALDMNRSILYARTRPVT